MLQAGKCIYKKNDPLIKINENYLYHAIKRPKETIASNIRQLRLLKNIDKNKYQVLKRNLPYVVTSIFHPQVRSKENFAWTNRFIVDIDNLSLKNTNPRQVKEKLGNDPRIFLMFTSAGEDGIKLLFALKDKMFDAAKYSIFYKAFVQKFKKQYQIDQVVDIEKIDVLNACFLSSDQEVYFNPNPELIKPENYVDFNNYIEINQLKKDIREEKKNQKKVSIKKRELPEDTLEKIKKKLNPNFKPKKKKNIYVPEEINKVTENIIKKMLENNVITTATIGINYGRKFKFTYENRKAEINLFYGKRGYTSVISPKNGTDEKLNEICQQLIEQWLVR